MKINEVVSEALNTSTGTPNSTPSALKKAWQGVTNIPGRVKGAVAGYQASQAQRTGREQVQKLVQPWVKQWNVIVGRDPSKANDPQALHDYAMHMTSGAVSSLPMPTDTSIGAVQTYLTNAIRQYLNAPQTQEPVQPGQPAQPLTRAQQIKQSRAQRAQATAPAPEPATGPDLAPGVSVTSPEPIMFKFQGQNIGLGSQGQWVNIKTRKPVDEPMQAFFTQQHDKFLGVGK